MKMLFNLALFSEILHVFSFITIVRSQGGYPISQVVCPPPDVPAYGKYIAKSAPFLPGDRVAYSCNEGFTLLGKEQRMCQSSGAWTDRTPFCDRPATIRNVQVTSDASSTTIQRVKDGSTATCYPWLKNIGRSLELLLHKLGFVLELKVFFEEGPIKIQILTGQTNNLKVCGEYDGYIEIGQWVTIKCNSNGVIADAIRILSLAHRPSNITICEIQVFIRDDFGCEYPPNIRVPYGFFVVERNIATLDCEEGFRSENSRLVCEDNSWKGPGPRCEELLCDPVKKNSSLPAGTEWVFLDAVRKVSAGTRRQLKCDIGYRKVGGPDKVVCQKNGTWTRTNATCVPEEKPKASTRTIVIGAVGAGVAILIIVLLTITIYLIKKQRHREVVVVYKASTDGSIAAGSEMEYGSAHYETIQYGVPIPPNSPRPAGMPPVLDQTYILPDDYKSTMRKQPTPADIAFGTLKQSTLYGS